MTTTTTITLNHVQSQTLAHMVRFEGSYWNNDRRVLNGFARRGLMTTDLSDMTPLGEKVRQIVRENFRHVPRPADSRIALDEDGTIHVTVEV